MKRVYSKEKIKRIIESSSSLKEAEGKFKISHSGLQYYLKKFSLTNHRHRKKVSCELPQNNLSKIRKTVREIRKRKKGLVERWKNHQGKK